MDTISKELNESLGLPTFKQIESDKYGSKVIANQSNEDIIPSFGDDTSNENTAWRDDMKWGSKDVHAYLFMVGDNKTVTDRFSLRSTLNERVPTTRCTVNGGIQCKFLNWFIIISMMSWDSDALRACATAYALTNAFYSFLAQRHSLYIKDYA